MMMYDPKILDLKYHINGLMPETICQSFIKFFEENVDSSTPEQSYKYKEIFGEKEEPTVEPTLSELLQEGFDKEQNGTTEETN